MVILKQEAPAKINLMLHVVGKQRNGLHHLQSLIAFVAVSDILTLTSGSVLSCKIEGLFSRELQEESNSVMAAARWLQNYMSTTQGAMITLEKNLPVASGLGGGTSDAAATIVGLLRLWDIHLSIQEKEQLVLASGALGADVPVCLAYQLGMGNIFWVDGSGKEAMPQALQGGSIPPHAVLVNPKAALRTEEIFRAFQSPFEAPCTWDGSWAHLMKMKNSLEITACAQKDAVRQTLDALKEIAPQSLVRMSGSGATCFALFHTASEATTAARILQQRYPLWWVKAGSLIFKDEKMHHKPA